MIWDAVIVGAGPAGAMTAYLLARNGCRILLVDKQVFPRYKVCGCCLGGTALAALESAGLGNLPRRLGGSELRWFRWAVESRVIQLPLPSGVCIAREAFDTALIDAAVAVGAEFRPATKATIAPGAEDAIRVDLTELNNARSVFARVAIDASGLAGATAKVASDSRLGVGAILGDGPSIYDPHVIHMAWNPNGYVGLVRLADGRLNIAAALDRGFVHSNGDIATALNRILIEVGWPMLPDASWRGTPLLTRRPNAVASYRRFSIGDASGYVEPFTGEGIGWALAAANRLAPIARGATRTWRPRFARVWIHNHDELLADRKRMCQWIAYGLRQPVVTRAAALLVSCAPGLARMLIARLNCPAQGRTRTA